MNNINLPRHSMCLFVTAACLMSACAKLPGNIPPAKIVGDPYGQMSCTQLRAQERQVRVQLLTVKEDQTMAAVGDAATVITTGAPRASRAGQDNEQGVALAKAQLIEIERLIGEKQCAL